GLKELFRKPADTGAQGVWLSDGYIYFAIIKYGSAEMPKRDEPKSIGIIHHIGFNVEDLEATCEALNAAHVTPNEFIPPNRPMETYSREANRKYLGPEGFRFDVRAHGWDEAIGGRMQLFKLVPANDEKA